MWEDPRGAEKCEEGAREDETRGIEKCCWDGIRGAAKCDAGSGVRLNGVALRKLEAVCWGIPPE